jgi:ureidoacrylate peracid hydrolase
MSTSGISSDLAAAARISHVHPLGTLEEKADPRHTALLIVDMQNDFCAEGGLVHKAGRDVSELQKVGARLPAFIDTARAAGNLIVFVKCVYSSDGNRYMSDVFLEQAARQRSGAGTQYPMCQEGTWQAEFYGDVQPKPGDVVVAKHRYSAFHNTDLDLVLRSHGIRTVALTGVLANVCVETTAREAFVRDYYVVLVGDGTASCVPEDHAMTLRNIERFFGEVSSIAALSALWSKPGRAIAAAE